MNTIAKVASDFAKHAETAEDVLRSCVADGRAATYEEKQFLEIQLGWNPKVQQRQLSRIGSVLRWQGVAGTSEERDALATAVAAAETDLEKRRPGLEKQISELQAELAQLRNRSTSQARRLAEVNQACETLSKDELLPPHIVEKCNAMVHDANNGIGREYRDLLTQVDHMVSLTSPEKHASEAMYLGVIERYRSDFVIHDKHGDPEKGNVWQTNRRLSTDWEKHKKSLERELPKLRNQLAKLKKLFDDEKDQAKEIKKTYWR